MGSILNSYFDKIYCINLDKRTDRWNEVQAQFKKHGIEVERFSAENGNTMGWKKDKYTLKPGAFNGVAGCIASHIKLYKIAKENNYKNILIIEDDCDFIDDLNEKFSKLIKEVPEDWDLLYLGGVHESRYGTQFKPERLTDNVLIGKRIITTTCYAIKNTIYDLAINTVMEDFPYFYTAIDGYLGAVIQPKCKTYAFHPPFAWQRASYSDVQNGHRDYANMMRYNNIK